MADSFWSSSCAASSGEPVTVEYLADYPQYADVLAAWLYEEFGRPIPGSSLERARSRVRASLNKSSLPLTVVCLAGDQPAGTAMLKIHEMEIRPEHEFWVGSVFVAPQYRRRGIGSALMKRVVGEAQRLGLGQLYLYTPDQERLYARLGWKAIERLNYQGREVVIMTYALQV